VSDRDFATTLRIAATPDEVFPYLTDPALMTRWMGDRADLDARAGGAFVVDINGIPVRGNYVEVDPPHRVVFTWGVAGDDRLGPGSTTVEITLRLDGAETVLDLVHRDLPPEELAKHDTGWGHFLELLSVVAADGDAGPDPWAGQPADPTKHR
jgi:uncharacterized protein YndB with AHSA1/START domain